MAEMAVTALVPWFGGKRTLAPKIVEAIGDHRAYWEVCCGSMATLLAKPRAAMETVNDLHGDLVNLARVVASGRWVELYRRLVRTLMHEALFDECKAEVADTIGPVAPSIDDVDREHVERAYRYFVMSWMGRNGSSGTIGYNITVARRYTSNGGSGAFRFRQACESVQAWHERLRSVLITQVDAFEMLDRIEDKAGSAIYVDPPYLKKGAKYVHDFSGIDHHRLAKALRRFERTRVVVSYYDEPWLRKQYPADDWEWIDCAMSKALVNQGMRDAGGAVKAPEVLIVNRRAS